MALYVALVWVLLALTGLLRLFGSERAPDRTAPVRTGSGWGAHLALSLLVLFTAWCAFQKINHEPSLTKGISCKAKRIRIPVAIMAIAEGRPIALKIAEVSAGIEDHNDET